MFIAKPEAEKAGFRFWKPLVWDKRTIGMGYHYRARYEFILFFEKGKRRLNDLGVADIISVPRIHGGYPAEKPVAVSEVLVRQSSRTGAAGRRSVHGLRQRWRGGAAPRPPVRRNRSESAGGAARRRRLREFGPGREPDGLPPASQPGLLELTDSPVSEPDAVTGAASTRTWSPPTSPGVMVPAD